MYSSPVLGWVEDTRGRFWMELWTGSARKQFGGSISDPHCRGLGGQDGSVISTPASGLRRSVDFLAIRDSDLQLVVARI